MKIEIRRLPDINKFQHLPAVYASYGRFGITTSGHFYVLMIQSSHPENTRIGGYWASSADKKVLYLSARGAVLGFEEFVTEIVAKEWITQIAQAAGVRLK